MKTAKRLVVWTVVVVLAAMIVGAALVDAQDHTVTPVGARSIAGQQPGETVIVQAAAPDAPYRQRHIIRRSEPVERYGFPAKRSSRIAGQGGDCSAGSPAQLPLEKRVSQWDGTEQSTFAIRREENVKSGCFAEASTGNAQSPYFAGNGVASELFVAALDLDIEDRLSDMPVQHVVRADGTTGSAFQDGREPHRMAGEFEFLRPQTESMSLEGLDTPYEATVEFDPSAATVDVSWEMDDAFNASLVMLVREGNAVRWSYADQPASGAGGSFRFTDVDLHPGEYRVVVWSFSDGMTNTGRLSSGVLVVPAETMPEDFISLEYAQYLEDNKPQAAAAIKALPWVADGVDQDERPAAEALIASGRWYPDVLDDLLQRPWVRDGVTVDEATAIRWMRWMGRYNPVLGERTRQQPWFGDGITWDEARAIEYLYRTGRYVPDLAEGMLQKAWAQDGIAADEVTVIRYLYRMARSQDEPRQRAVLEIAIQILGMPFLDTVESADALALRSLERLERNGGDAFLEIMSHPTLSDGITDEEAKIVVLLGATHENQPESVAVLLDGTSVYLEERVIELPLSGEVLLTVIRLRDQQTPSMDFLEHSVRTIEDFVGAPLPTKYIALYFDDATSFSTAAGTNNGTHVAMLPLYDEEDGSRWQRTPFVIAHEVGHYYFGGSNQSWIDEGAAEFLGAISENARVGTAIGPDNDPCTLFQNIAELERVAPEKGTSGYRCYYSLGERLFLDLYDSLHEDTFRQGLRDLHLKSVREDATDRCEGTDLGVCHLEAAFKADASVQVAATVDEAVERWYGEVPDATVEFNSDADTVDVSWVMGSALDKSLVMLVRQGDAVAWDYVYKAADTYGDSARLTNLDLAPGEYQVVVWSFSDGVADAGHTSSGAFTVPDEATLVDFTSLENARYLEQKMPQAAAAIRALPWVADGITPPEKGAVQELLYIAPFYVEVFNALIWQPWLADSVSDVEFFVIESIRSIAYMNEPEAERIINMSFIETLEPPDVAAMTALRQLAHLNPQVFRAVLSHSTLNDGIDDYWAQIVALLYGVSTTNPALIETLLDPNRVTVEERSIHLPLSGDVDLAVIRIEPGAQRSMELLEHSARSAEAFMGEPLPNRYVGLLFGEALNPGSAGTNFATHIAIHPKYDVDDGSHEAGSVAHIIAHEVAHFYWRGNQAWVDEGAADFMASISEQKRTGQLAAVTNLPCAYARNIAQLESINPEQADAQFNCNYALGERILVVLYRTMGETGFRQAMRQLYLASKQEDETNLGRDTELGISHVRQAFTNVSAGAETVIDRWYQGDPVSSTSSPDGDPVDSRLPQVNGRIDQAFITIGEAGQPTNVLPADGVDDWVYLKFRHSHRLSGNPVSIPLRIVQYYQDGLAFDRSEKEIIAQSEYIGGSHYHVIGFPPGKKWAAGRYWVYVYDADRKVAEVSFTVESPGGESATMATTRPSMVSATYSEETQSVEVSWVPDVDAQQHWVVLFSLPGYDHAGRVWVGGADADSAVFEDVPPGRYEVLVASYSKDVGFEYGDDTAFELTIEE